MDRKHILLTCLVHKNILNAITKQIGDCCITIEPLAFHINYSFTDNLKEDHECDLENVFLLLLNTRSHLIL